MNTNISPNTADNIDNIESLPTKVQEEISKVIWKPLNADLINEEIDDIINKYNQNAELAAIFVEYIDPSLLSGFSSGVRMQVAADLVESSKQVLNSLNASEKTSEIFIRNLVTAFAKAWKSIAHINLFIEENYSTKESEKIANIDIAEIFQEIKWKEAEQNNFLSKLKKESEELFNFLEKERIIIIKDINWNEEITISHFFVKDTILKLEAWEISEIEAYIDNIFNNFKDNKNWKILKKLIISEITTDLAYQEFIKRQEKNYEEENETENNNEENKQTSQNKNNTQENNYSSRVDYLNQNVWGWLNCWWWIVLYEAAVEYKWEKIKMPVDMARWLNSDNISNFVDFYWKLKQLKLNFLWDKYSPEFFTLLSNNDIDLRWAMVKWEYNRVLQSTLSFIWKNIWLFSEKDENWEDKNTSNKQEFDTLGWAQKAFKDIVSSNMINRENYNSPVFTPVESIMIKLGLINPQIPYLNISKFN